MVASVEMSRTSPADGGYEASVTTSTKEAAVSSKKSHSAIPTTRNAIQSEDEMRLSRLGYKQEAKRIFGLWSNFGLAASMISVLLGVIPLYTYSLINGGPAVMLWSWVVIGFITLILVSSLAEICCAYPTMGALYYWAYRLGGDEWGPFSSWMAGWCNLLGQVAGVASGGYSGAEVLGDIATLTSGVIFTPVQLLAVFAVVLIFAGIINTFAETLLTRLCSISVVWHIVGTVLIVALMIQYAPTLKSAEYVATDFNNATPFESSSYVILIGSLAAASTFTGYDTAAHVAEETSNSHNNSPIAMIGSVINCIILGILLISGLNYCIQDINVLIDPTNSYSAYTILWLQTVGKDLTVFFEIITFVAIECSNCANLTSASRMIYSMARDGAIPLSSFWYNMDSRVGGPVRSIWLSVVLAFILGIPGLTNPTVLGALFSLTATGLYSSYFIPIFLRVTVSRDSFQAAEFSLGKYSIPMGWISSVWCLFMIIILCLPQDAPISANNMNYSPIALGIILVGAWFSWVVSARFWFKGMKRYTAAETEIKNESLPTDADYDGSDKSRSRGNSDEIDYSSNEFCVA